MGQGERDTIHENLFFCITVCLLLTCIDFYTLIIVASVDFSAALVFELLLTTFVIMLQK